MRNEREYTLRDLIELIVALLKNRVLMSGVIAWLIAQVAKAIIYAIVNRQFDAKRLVGDGGMPSGHSATVSAVATTCALTYGADSGLFAISMILAVITCHDAMNSRQEIGKQAALLNEIVRDLMEGESPEAALEEFVGHTPTQVCVGITLGILVGLFFHYAL